MIKLKKTMLPVYTVVIPIFLSITLWGNYAVAALAESAPVTNRKCIIIDAGHGGEDGGAISCTGLSESQYNLQIALRLNDMMHLLGIDTLMIRETDRSVYTSGNTIAQKKVSDLKERLRIINNAENALLVSIHQNYFPASKYCGSQVFYSDAAGSRELAHLLQAGLVQHLDPGNRRECKRANGIYLMDRAAIPAVLIECGFLSNAEDEAKLRDPEYQKELSGVIAVICSRYLQGKNSIA